VYRAPELAGAFDAVATCFFIDTAHNVLEYLEVGGSIPGPAFSLFAFLLCDASHDPWLAGTAHPSTSATR
jgi:hypothetical protein